jgi:cytochrome c biogenesis protein CcdA
MTGPVRAGPRRGRRPARGRVLVGSVLFVLGFAVPFVMLGFAAGS